MNVSVVNGASITSSSIWMVPAGSRCTRAACTPGGARGPTRRTPASCRIGAGPHGRGVGHAHAAAGARAARTPHRPFPDRRAPASSVSSRAGWPGGIPRQRLERGQPRRGRGVAVAARVGGRQSRARLPPVAARRRARRPSRAAQSPAPRAPRRGASIDVGRANLRQCPQRRRLHAHVRIVGQVVERRPRRVGRQRRQDVAPGWREPTSRGRVRHSTAPAETLRHRAAPPPSSRRRAPCGDGDREQIEHRVEGPAVADGAERGDRLEHQIRWRRAWSHEHRQQRRHRVARRRRGRARESLPRAVAHPHRCRPTMASAGATPRASFSAASPRKRERRRVHAGAGGQLLQARPPRADRRIRWSANATGHHDDTGCAVASSTTRRAHRTDAGAPAPESTAGTPRSPGSSVSSSSARSAR